MLCRRNMLQSYKSKLRLQNRVCLFLLTRPCWSKRFPMSGYKDLLLRVDTLPLPNRGSILFINVRESIFGVSNPDALLENPPTGSSDTGPVSCGVAGAPSSYVPAGRTPSIVIVPSLYTRLLFVESLRDEEASDSSIRPPTAEPVRGVGRVP